MATVDRLSRVRQLSSATPALRPMPTARPLTGLTSMVQQRRLNVVHRPKSFGSASLRRPKGDKGFFSNLGNLLTLPGQVAKGLPTFVGKVGQTVGGLGEGAFDFLADLASEATGREKEFYTSRFETDLEKGRKLGLKGTDLIAFASQRQYPAVGELIKSGETTAGDIGELATFGQADFGEPGFNLYQAYKRGELPMRLLEDVGNVMLAGRLVGAGSVASRAGKAATAAGAPRLGTAVRRAGYFSEQPIAATLRGTAGLVGRGIERFGGDATAGRLGRVGQIAGRVRGSEQPIRMLGQASVENRRRLYQGRVPTEFRILDDLEARRDDYQRRGMEMPEAERAQLSRQQRRVETIVSRTGVPKLIARDQRKFANEQKANRDLYTQERIRFVERGPIPESPAKVRRQAERWAAEAERTSDPVKAEALRARSEQANKLVEAAEADTTNRMTDKQYIDDSAAAATLLTNGKWPTVAGRLADGTLSVDEALTVLRSDDLLAAYEAETGYTVTPGALQRAMDYATGRADIIDQVGIEQYIGIARRFSNKMTNLRQTGEGMVRGAASPLETGNYPMPEYLVSELQKASPQVRSLLNEYIGNIIDDLLSDAERQNPNIRAELGVEKTKPENLLKMLSDARPDSEGYYLAALGVSEAFDQFAGTPNPRFSPGDISLDMVDKVREFFRRPLIYPANVRYMMATEQRLLRLARSQETQKFADGLTQLVTEYPDLISDSLFESVMNAVNKANDETTRYDRKTWNELKNILAKVDRQLAQSLERTSTEMGVLGGRRQNALTRINELRDSLRMAQEYVDTLVNNPEQLVPLRQTETGLLQGLGQEQLATQLESAALKEQQAEVKARLKGVGKTVGKADPKPPRVDYDQIRTGEPFNFVGYRGEGGSSSLGGNIRGTGEDSVFGPALYVARTTEKAEDFARDYSQSGNPIVGTVQEVEVSLRNPLVIENEAQWVALTKEAGWPYANLRGRAVDQWGEIPNDIASMRKLLEDKGYDGLVIRLPKRGDANWQGDSNLEKVTGGDQVVVFRPESMPTGATAEPRLQRQLERPIQEEQERLQQQQQQDARTIENLRTKYAEEDAAKLEAAQTLKGATEVSAQLARPTGPALLGEEQLIYYPAGPSRTVQDTATVSKRPRTEGMTPEMVASVERMRQGDVLALSPGQQAARVSEVLNNTGRNIIVQNIIKNRDYTTTVAEVLPQEVRDSLMAEATRMHEGKTNIESAERARLIKGDYQILVMRELSRQGLEPISTAGMPDPMDPFVERDAWRALNEPVPASAIEDNTILMTKGLRKNLVAEFEVAETRVPKAVQDVFQKVRYGTGSWKATILPFSIRWQIGDAVGNVLNAWVRGDITPTQMYKYMGIAYDMLRESQLTPEGQPSTLRSIMFGQELQGSMGDPLLQLLESFGLQQSGYKMMDVISMLREAADNREKGSPTLDVLEGNRARSTRAGQAFGQFQQGAFNFNEFQNRVARQAVALYNLDKYLKDNNLTFDDVTYERVSADKGLESAVIGAVGEANRVLGAFSELSPFERQVMRTIFPFWSWMKFINKAAAQLLIDQPDRVLFYGHLGSMMMEPDADGLWEFLQGKTNVFGKYVDLSFFNPYTDALLFTGKDVNQMIANAIEETQAISPAITLPLYGIGETFYQARGGQPFLFPTFSRPSYLEGRPGETTRSVGDTLGGLGYFTLRQLGGPLRNLPELLPSRIPLIAPEGRIRGTDIAVGSPGVPRFPQGSLRTTGRYSVRRLSPSGGRLSAIMRTFGLPGALVDVDVAQRAARENVLAGREARLRRIGERRAATGRF